MNWTKEQVKDFIENIFKRIPKNIEIEALYAEFHRCYEQGKIDSLNKIKDVLNIKECECR